MRADRQPGLIVVISAVLILTGCAGSGDNASQGPPTNSAAATTGTRVAECTAMATSAENLANQVRQFFDGNATGDQVRSAMQEVTDAIADAKAVVGSDTRARLDDAEDALQRARDAVTAQPVDLSALRAAANDVVDAMRDAISLCGTPTGATPTS